MNFRKGRLFATCSDDKGARRFRTGEVEQYDSINAAKRANGRNATTCERFPPSLTDLHAEALELNEALSKQPEAA